MIIEVKTLFNIGGGHSFPLTVECSDTVETVKQMICDLHGIPSEQQRLIFGGRALYDENTLWECAINKGDIVHLVMALRGGGGHGTALSSVGPDLDSSLRRGKWVSDAPRYRVHVPGLNVEFAHPLDPTMLVIGQVGYGEFDADTLHKEALCPHCGISPTSATDVTRLFFNNCVVRFDGTGEDDEAVKSTHSFGDQPCYFQGRANYRRLTLSVLRPVKETLEGGDPGPPQ